jgi:hypothetical protein
MIEKLALVRIAFCNAPAFSSARCNETSVVPSSDGAAALAVRLS